MTELALANEMVEVLEIEGFPIGLVEQARNSENLIGLTPGDRVFLCTDGITEAQLPSGQALS